MIGVIFSKIAGNEKEGYWYIFPAIFALIIALSDLFYIINCLEETLPIHRRAKSLSHGIYGAIIYINPIDLFQFNGVTELSPNGNQFFSFTYFYILSMNYFYCYFYFYFRIEESKDLGPLIFPLFIRLQWSRIYLDISYPSYIFFYKYATGLHVSCHWFNNGHSSRSFCQTYSC